MDQNNPARYLDTAYGALKSNPGATNQILQAAAQGAPVGLKGLAAAAAQQSQQQAQQAMAALQQQGPQPNVIQKLAQSGIMSQMDTGLPMAPQMGAPEEMPSQMMAGGGLVSFADGGNVLPPDVIDAIQSHFAEGGDVRGFAEGDIVDLLRKGLTRESGSSSGIDEAFRRAMGWGMGKEAAEEEMRRLGEKIAGQRIAQGLEEAAGSYNPSAVSRMTARMAEGVVPELSMTEKMAQGARAFNPEPYWYEGAAADFPPAPRSMSRLEALDKVSPEARKYLSSVSQSLDELAPVAEKGMGYLAKAKSAAKPILKYAPYLGPALTAYDAYSMAKDPNVQEAAGAFAEDWKREMPTWMGGDEPTMNTLDVQDFAPSGMYKPEVKEPKATTTPATWKPEPHDGHEVVPRQRVIPEGTKVDKPFDEAKKDVPSAAVTPDSEAKGLEALSGGGMERMRDLLAELRGHKELSPEMSQKLADLDDKARTSTIIQSVLGGLAGGLSNPYGGRFALGSSAAGALGGYQKGIGSEEEIGRKAFDVLRGYADAPAEEQAAAMDKVLGITAKTAELQSEERRAMLKPSFEDRFALERWKEMQRLLHPEVHGGALAPRGSLTQGDLANLRAKAEEQARKDATDALNVPPFKAMSDEDQKRRADQYYTKYLAAAGQGTGLGGNINTAQSGGLGGGSPLIITRQ